MDKRTFLKSLSAALVVVGNPQIVRAITNPNQKRRWYLAVQTLLDQASFAIYKKQAGT